MPFLLAEILNFQGSTHQYGVGSFSKLINKDVGVEDFKQIGDLIMEYCRMSAKIAYNAI